MVDHLGELRPPRLGDIGKDPRLGHRAEIALDRRPPARRNEIETDRTREDIAVRDPASDAVRREESLVIFGHALGLAVTADRGAEREPKTRAVRTASSQKRPTHTCTTRED